MRGREGGVRKTKVQRQSAKHRLKSLTVRAWMHDSVRCFKWYQVALVVLRSELQQMTVSHTD